MTYGANITDASVSPASIPAASSGREARTCRLFRPTKFEMVINAPDGKDAWPQQAAGAARASRRGDRIRRREFIALLGGAAAAWPIAAQARLAGKRPTIGLLVSSTPADESQRVGAFTQRLHQLGWIDGRTITIELRSAEGRPERAHEM